MKKRGAALLLALLFAALCAGGCAAQESGVFPIVTSFYPMYLLTLNVAEGIEGVSVHNMADQTVGCLHDYQLQTRDVATLEDARALIVNGGGMERFMDKVFSLRADLPVIEASAGIDMLASSEAHDHGDEAHDDHEDGEANAHVWLDPKLAARQVENIAEGLAAADPAHAGAYRANALAYAERLMALDEELAGQLAPLKDMPIVIFHEGFAYMAKAYGLSVVGVVEHEESDEPGTREIAQLCDLVKDEGVRALFVEAGTTERAAQTIARETGAVLGELDPITSGAGELDGYERAMRQNAAALLAALSTEEREP